MIHQTNHLKLLCVTCHNCKMIWLDNMNNMTYSLFYVLSHISNSLTEGSEFVGALMYLFKFALLFSQRLEAAKLDLDTVTSLCWLLSLTPKRSLSFKRQETISILSTLFVQKVTSLEMNVMGVYSTPNKPPSLLWILGASPQEFLTSDVFH